MVYRPSSRDPIAEASTADLTRPAHGCPSVPSCALVCPKVLPEERSGACLACPWRAMLLMVLGLSLHPFAEPLETTKQTRMWIRLLTASCVRWGLGGDPHFSVRSVETRTDRATLLDISK